MLELLILILIFSSVILLCSQLAPLVLGRLQQAQDKKITETERQLDNMFINVKRKRLFLWYTLSPFALGLAAFVLLHNFVFTLLAIIIGIFLPTLALRQLQALRKARFQAQLIDGLMMLASCLKGGLSFLQAIEILVEEMPAPFSQEFGLVLRENKMGVGLEQSLYNLKKRMNIDELGLVINSILVARETGGDLTKVLGRLSITIRDNRKLKDSIRTLTLQGRIQGVIMSILPVVFGFGVVTINRHHFDIMLQSETGRLALFAAAALQIIGIVLIHRFSKIRI